MAIVLLSWVGSCKLQVESCPVGLGMTMGM
ncbi:hypothetical protein A2U01_0096064, partial [Trifolium medium]|nr:hypothetical protein [Trifolium medium]